MSEISIGNFQFKVDSAGADSFELEVQGLGVGIRNRVSTNDLVRLSRWSKAQAEQGRPRPDSDLLTQIVEHGYRSLSKSLHSDLVPGSDAPMQNLNDAIAWLKNEFKS